ncbi:hypothetical protein pb186bvf_014239 [Paramecium bursaria]
MTECLDMMDLLQSQKSSHTKIRTNQQLKESNHQVTNTSIQRSVKSQKSQRSKRSINSNATRKSDQVEIAYFRTLKARRNSSSSISSTQSLENSLLTMEKRFKKHNQQKPDMTDQKYLISTFVQMNADYKKVILIIKSYMQTLKGVLSDQKVKDDQVLRVDGFFQKHADILQVKIQDYFKIKECLHKLIKMKIQEPYAQRVKDRIRQVEKHNKLFEVLRVYIEAFRFVDIQGFEYFKEDIELMEELKRPPQDEKIGEIFDEQITSIIQQIETTKDTQEGEILSKVFEYKLELILKWKEIIIDVMTFRYAFNIRYNLSNTTEKIMKSKKIYERVLQHTEKIKQFMITYYSLPKPYLGQVESIQDELNLMKSQVIQWNIKLRNEQRYKDLLPLLKFNMMLKRAIKQLQNLTKLKHQKKYEIQATEIIIQVQMNHQAMKDQLIKFYRSPEMKNDEFLQKQFNKSVIYLNIFDDLKNEFEIKQQK